MAKMRKTGKMTSRRLLSFVCAVGAALSVARAADGLVSFPKSTYLDLMETAVGAYSDGRIAAFVESVEKGGISEHGFARLTSNLGVLLAHGRLQEKRGTFVRMMDLCAREMPVALKRGNRHAGNDFAVKEVACMIDEVERAELFPPETTARWRRAFAGMIAEEIYTCQPGPGDKTAANWCVFGAASEQARLRFGMGGSRAYVEKYVGDQLRFFDPNGMYCDPGQPMVYDFVTRLQFAAILAFGFDGPSRGRLAELMERSAEATLAMQSATGEIPFGGRSNQFLHNETFYAALCEYYAGRFKAKGETDTARRFRAAARRAVESLRYWTGRKAIRHVKNRYPTETGYGCEAYAYFDKYMVTMGSWAYLAYRFADDTVVPATQDEKDVTFVTSDRFHRVMVRAGEYSAQYDWKAQDGYDASGLGRFQRRGAPPVIGLASPFPRKPRYKIDLTNATDLAIGPVGWTSYALLEAADGCCRFGCGGAEWTSRLSSEGLEMELVGRGEQVLSLPVFVTDGEGVSTVTRTENSVAVTFAGWTCRYEVEGRVVDTGLTYCNRNGHCRRFDARGRDRVRVRMRIERAAVPTYWSARVNAD